MFLILRTASSSSRLFRRTPSILMWMAGRSILLGFNGLFTSVISMYYYLKLIMLLTTGRNQEKMPPVKL